MHKYNILKIKDITFDSKQRIDNAKLRVLTSLYKIQTDWLITSLKHLLEFGGNSKSESRSNSMSIETRLYSSHNLMINVT